MFITIEQAIEQINAGEALLVPSFLVKITLDGVKKYIHDIEQSPLKGGAVLYSSSKITPRALIDCLFEGREVLVKEFVPSFPDTGDMASAGNIEDLIKSLSSVKDLPLSSPIILKIINSDNGFKLKISAVGAQ
ncbi:TPA: hypothetical protein ACVU5P_004210 [Vibrio parahaemolyticus]